MHIHPALVHFPIVLLIVAGICYALARWSGELPWSKFGWYLHLSGLVGLALAVFSGLSADSDLILDTEPRELLDQHTLQGYVLVWWFALLAVWYFLRHRRVKTTEWIFFLLLFALGLGLLGYSAWLGGHLVYDFGVGVQKN